MKSLWMLGAGFSFAVLAAFVKLTAEQGVPTGQILFFRSLFSAVALLGFMQWRRVSVTTPLWKTQISGSLGGVISLAAYFHAIKMLPLATAVTLNYTSPIFLGLLLMFNRQSPVTAGPLAALMAGFVGVILLLQPSFDGTAWPGYALAVLSAVLGAFYFVHIRRLGAAGEPSVRTVFYFSAISTITSVPLALSASATKPYDIEITGLLLGAGFLATIGQVMLTFAYQGNKPLIAGALGYSQVVFSVLFGILIWHDAIPAHVGLGILLIVVSGIMTTATQRR
jgi:drug/metabolite transporter (DMT)-like permease